MKIHLLKTLGSLLTLLCEQMLPITTKTRQYLDNWIELLNTSDRSRILVRCTLHVIIISKKKSSQVFAAPQVEGESELDTPVKFIGTLSLITRLELLHGTKIIGSYSIPKRIALTSFVLQSENNMKTLGYQKFTILGYVRGSQVLQTFRYIRFVPFSGGYLQVDQGANLIWDFSFGKYTVLYNKATDVTDGWNTKNGSLVLSDGSGYKDNSNSEVSFFLRITGNCTPTLFLKGDYDTEAGFDFFMVIVRVNGTSTTVLNVSGNDVLDEIIDLSRYAGNEKVEVALAFQSDGAITKRGVKIDHVRFSSD